MPILRTYLPSLGGSLCSQAGLLLCLSMLFRFQQIELDFNTSRLDNSRLHKRLLLWLYLCHLLFSTWESHLRQITFGLVYVSWARSTLCLEDKNPHLRLQLIPPRTIKKCQIHLQALFYLVPRQARIK